ncbi:tRNA glutamyl-Q(34) synthetase GluQRS [Silvibacterium dinghuense]|uniref:tRNA glutamyl-Q(34) synthetase GluQRS n=2 Tax=Silvibacterium dinghuense TaxID=1560006 RepID=A0A4Q1SI11_9BACT|nr:tRNA glutamyl-Q(34) synthetase GluQRS [Silvibacterium dinghuense]GGG97164.1 glutamyl-Q tRNA(Asp) synthetase [Silvibacterium dinghuense]
MLNPLTLLADRQRTYRGRLAPSPTGLLHVGHAATFLAAYQRAKDAGGVLVLRNEDLDTQRARPEFVTAMVTDLRWLGIHWQEGPELGGRYRPYSQSKRRTFYLEAWRKLRDGGWIYPCRCSRKDLAAAVGAPHESQEQGGEDDEPRYPGTCRPLPVMPGAGFSNQDEKPRPYDEPAGVNWRFRVPDGRAIEFDDIHFGPQRYVAGRDFGDFLVWRRDDVPSYQLACVVDDAAMRITEVVRGEDLLKSTARQILLYEALGLEPPRWYHCPLIRDKDGNRLAKRHNALALRTLREMGRDPHDLRLALLGMPSRIAPRD